ncbi:MAG: hypothetical protein IT443_07330 [Phycisphaeraceae bacterium]|nr:hypothetical protein [Phycisphaeraceae bacterium]
MKQTLTSCERVKRMMEHRDHDRVPRSDGYWDETIARWQAEGLAGSTEQVWQLLDRDFAHLCWSWPRPFPGRQEVLEQNEETRVVIDGFGQKTREWKHRSGTPEHLGWECDSRQVWENRIKPALRATDLHVHVADAQAQYAQGRTRERWCYLAGVEGFEATRKIMGDELAMIAMAEDPDWIRDVSRVHTDMVLRDFEALWKAGVHPDGVWIYGDMAYNHATVCSPAMYRDTIWPDHKRLADWAHAHGCKFIYHTDGDIRAVMDLYIEAGFDCLQPLEAKANMDIRELCPVYGDKLAMFGNIDMLVAGSNDRERIEHEVRSKLAAGMATRAYAYHSDHSVPPTVSWATYQLIIELLDRYGNYE